MSIDIGEKETHAGEVFSSRLKPFDSKVDRYVNPPHNFNGKSVSQVLRMKTII